MNTYQASPLIPPGWTRRAACLDRFDLDWIDPAPEQSQLCRVNPLESWRRCYATSALTCTADIARAAAI